jgi:hypothetical protein
MPVQTAAPLISPFQYVSSAVACFVEEPQVVNIDLHCAYISWYSVHFCVTDANESISLEDSYPSVNGSHIGTPARDLVFILSQRHVKYSRTVSLCFHTEVGYESKHSSVNLVRR